ncbi:hypothetical protein RGQ13_07200 [Thalassotalea psychrophila]|uniref:DUF2897 domain-containing protein n=1 Tax=Thalassotalea psychrophila TaxID=3065647 RepID=A0ABY9TY45_9GAMM|nr:hypothetical protein RGQ13_07200 [Colwelliaceae bacterium SQ149]
MDSWVIIAIIIAVVATLIGNLSMLQKSAKPIRKNSLNDLQETLPRAGVKRKEEIEQQREHRKNNR